MAEIRRDVVSGRWVIIATERAARPHDFIMGRGEPKDGFCPFCEGNEDRTPPELTAVAEPDRAPNTEGWKVRVVPNKFPALRLDGEVNAQGLGLYHRVAGVGAHEVIIESPRHIITPTQMTAPEFEPVVRTYVDRCGALSMDDRLAYVLVFKNVGEAAGASLEHSHSQIIAVPVIPRRVHDEMECSEVFHNRRRACLFCDVIEQELKARERVVIESRDFVVLSPYAARFPFEMMVLPKHHAPHFHQTEERLQPQLAHVLHEALVRMELCLEYPPFNYAIHTSPVTGLEPDYYHWHIEIIPRVTRVAGFEWGSGFYINPMEPERATEFMRALPPREVRERTGLPEVVQTAPG
jgi:UDPglucose--hexose-1-phosphate uridylyltransferase